MNENELFQAALGLLPPWVVSRCTFDEAAGRLDIHLDFPRGSVFPCPICGVASKAYDTDELTWRHLNFFQHQAFLPARTPRVECSHRGIHRVAVPWARAGSGFTLLFEALVMMLAKSMPVLAVARLINEHDTLVWRIVTHYVDAARAKANHSKVTQVGVDETASRRGQRYVSLFVDLEQRKVLFVTPGKDAATVAAFAQDLQAHQGDPKAVTEVSADMSKAFIAGIAAGLPNAQITFDKFHVVSLVNNAVDQVRRLEPKEHPELIHSRYVWLKNPENLTARQGEKFDALDIAHSHLKTARAYQIRLTFQDLYRQPVLSQTTNQSNANAVARLERDIAHMSALVGDLLSLTKGTVRKPDLVSLDLTELVARVIAQENAAGADLAMQVEPGVRVLADDECLIRVLANLVRNVRWTRLARHESK